MKLLTAFVFFILTLLGCAHAPVTGRSQLMLVPSDMVIKLSAQAYYSGLQPFKNKGGIDSDPRLAARVTAITSRLIHEAILFNPASSKWQWETHVVDTDELNAYCMPGGKMVIYSGLIKKLNLADDEIAAVMAHEIGHAIANHGAEKMSANLGMEIVMASLSEEAHPTPGQEQALVAAAALIIQLPHSRIQEGEADRIGIHLMSLAGYNPTAAVNLFKKFQAAQQGKAVAEFFSDHPSDASRIKNLTAWVPVELPYYEKAHHQRVAEESHQPTTLVPRR